MVGIWWLIAILSMSGEVLVALLLILFFLPIQIHEPEKEHPEQWTMQLSEEWWLWSCSLCSVYSLSWDATLQDTKVVDIGNV